MKNKKLTLAKVADWIEALESMPKLNQEEDISYIKATIKIIESKKSKAK